MSIGQMFSGGEHAAIEARDAAIAELERAQESVTVCITYHDEPREVIDRALNSVFAQTRPALEILVIDDGSERPLEIDQASAPYLRAVRVTNRHLSGARNTGLMLAKGIAFLPLDADDTIEPTFIEKTLPLILSGEADVVQVGLQENGDRHGTYFPGFNVPCEDVTLEMEIEMNRFYYCGLYRTALLREVGGYNGLMQHGYEDWDMHVDLMTRGARYRAVNEVLFHYTTSSDGMLADTERNWRQWNLDEMRRHHRW